MPKATTKVCCKYFQMQLQAKGPVMRAKRPESVAKRAARPTDPKLTALELPGRLIWQDDLLVLRWQLLIFNHRRLCRRLLHLVASCRREEVEV